MLTFKNLFENIKNKYRPDETSNFETGLISQNNPLYS